jgi:LysM domain-containing protein
MFLRLALIAAAVGLLVGAYAHPSGGAGKPQVYVVRPSDTLWSIASTHYAGDPREVVWRLERKNRLAGTTLVPGQRLVLP